jgi:hypothetical protein
MDQNVYRYVVGMRDAVFERFPEWDAAEDKVRWEEGEVSPSDALLHLLEDPNVALEWLTSKDPAGTITEGGPDTFRGFARWSCTR